LWGVVVRHLQQAVVAAAVTGLVVAAHRSTTGKADMSTSTPTAPKRRAATKAAPPKKAVAKKPAGKKIPKQRTSEVDNLGLRTEELEVAEHEARDARLFAALDWA
jgi:hypothetical protein